MPATAHDHRFDALFGASRGLSADELAMRRSGERSAREAAAERRERAHMAPDGWEMDSGGVVEFPDDDGRIRLRDADGDCYEWHDIGEPEWQGLADLFGNLPEDFAPEDEED
jgi:hypothetical protein